MQGPCTCCARLEIARGPSQLKACIAGLKTELAPPVVIWEWCIAWTRTVFAHTSRYCVLLIVVAVPVARSNPESPRLYTVNTEDEPTHSAVMSPVQEGEGLLAVVARGAEVIRHLQSFEV